MISTILSNQAKRLFDICLIFNHQDCLLCGAHSGADLLCQSCRPDLPQAPAPACPRCAAPVEHGGDVCGSCLQHPPAFDRALAALRYAFPADELVQALKYRDQLALAPLFADLLQHAVASAPRPDLLIPMPLHPDRARERGFNQALEIARPLSRALQLPVDQTSLSRNRNTSPQAMLPLDQRRKNIRGAFACADAVAGKHIALIDDVMTSGATLDEAASALKRAGACEVSVWVVARALPHH